MGSALGVFVPEYGKEALLGGLSPHPAHHTMAAGLSWNCEHVMIRFCFWDQIIIAIPSTVMRQMHELLAADVFLAFPFSCYSVL
jgi:hypothetical protein